MDKKIEELASFLKKGSKIHIKKSQRGSFTSYCGGKVTNECIQRGKNSPNPKIRKKATFAANARTWKHDEGGTISSDKNAAYEPTLEDIVKFATSFETFQDGPYQIPNYKGEMQTLAGFGSANPKIIELASQGKLTRDIALSEVRNNFNKIYNRLSLEVPGFDKLPSGAKLGIADIVYNGSGVDSFKRKSPNLIRAISLYDPSNPESLQAVAKAMSHSKNAGGWLGVRSSARRAMALGEYKWNWPELDKYGRQVNRAQYRGPQDWKSSPYYQKYAKGGGLIYTPFLQGEETNKGTYTPFIPEITSDYTPSFPVEPVRNYTPVEQAPEQPKKEPNQEVKTPEFEIEQMSAPRDATTVTKQNVEKILGSIEYKTSDIDVGNMQELIDLMRDEGISFRITSGRREGAKTSNGNKSHHSVGNAIDITPIKGQSWENLIAQMKRSSRFIAYMKSHGLGILDERSKDILSKTGGTGAHFHIGPDRNAIRNFETLIG